MSKKELVKRLNWYYPMERMHAFFTFPLMAVYLIFNNSLQDIIFLIYGLLFCIVVLFQGQHYWKLKLFTLTGKPFDQRKQLNFFRKSKQANLVMIGLIPLVFVIQLYLAGWTLDTKNLILWSVVANVFGVLEHINYYNRQLMIDNISDLNYVLKNKKLKVASLAKDIAGNEI